jgi:hypothetical protein
VKPYFCLSHGQNVVLLAAPMAIGLPFRASSDATPGCAMTTVGFFWKVAPMVVIGRPCSSAPRVGGHLSGRERDLLRHRRQVVRRAGDVVGRRRRDRDDLRQRLAGLVHRHGQRLEFAGEARRRPHREVALAHLHRVEHERVERPRDRADGADDDVLSDGCVRFGSIRDTSAEPSGFIFLGSGEEAFVSVQHRAVNDSLGAGNHGALLKMSGFKVKK